MSSGLVQSWCGRGFSIAHLNELRQDIKDLLPAVEPEAVAVPVPVLSELREVGVEPGRDGHHEGLSWNSTDPGSIRVDGLLGRALVVWPGIPWDCSLEKKNSLVS